MLSDLQHFASYRDFECCKSIKFEEVRKITHNMKIGRATEPGELLVEFQKIHIKQV